MSSSSMFSIELEYKGALNSEQKKVFETAARRWEEIITGPSSGNRLSLRIKASGKKIDGPGRTLGQAGPTQLQITDGLPLAGIMEFDTSDLEDMEKEGTLQSVILHEMAHVLGIGTLWRRKRLLTGSGTDNPEYIGKLAIAEYAKLLGGDSNNKPTAIPVANTGGSGTAEGHWRESTFDYELMTGYTEDGSVDMPISLMTVAALQDLGWSVNYDKADNYKLPIPTAVTGLEGSATTTHAHHYCKMKFPDIVKVGESDDGKKSCCVLC